VRIHRRLALAASVLVLAGLSVALRISCATEAGAAGAGLPGCGGDLGEMWLRRGLAAGRIPYLQPFLDPGSGQLVTVEYPVLTGMLMWLFSLPGSYPAFLVLSGLTMAAAAVGIVIVLQRWCGSRAWLWAAAPALVHYLAYNYDALPTLTVVAALGLLLGRDPVSVARARYLGAAAILGVGGGLKLFPLLFLLPLALWLAFGRPGPDQAPGRSRLVRAAAATAVGLAVLAAVNLPVAIANPQGWWLPFSFQAVRPIDSTTLSVWFLVSAALPAVGQAQLMMAAMVATVVGIAAAALTGWLIGRRRGSFPLLGTTVTILVAYLVLNKVFSPQHILWLLPLLILAGVGWRVVVTYLVIDVLMFWTIGLLPYARAAGDPQLLVLAGAGPVLAMIARLACVLVAAVQAAGTVDPTSPPAPAGAAA
jgi:uncharacterized membrane protein